MALPTLSPRHLDRMPVVLAGCTWQELSYLAIIATSVFFLPIIICLMLGIPAIGITIGLIGLFLTATLGTQQLNRIKRGKPDHHLRYSVALFKEQVGWGKAPFVHGRQHWSGLR